MFFVNLLRGRAAQRGYNSVNTKALCAAVRVFQWAYQSGREGCLVSEIMRRRAPEEQRQLDIVANNADGVTDSRLMVDNYG